MQKMSVAQMDHKTTIKQSWQRCRDLGLTHHSQPNIAPLDRSNLSSLLEEHHRLIETTHNEVLPCYENLLINSKSQVMLADHQGYVLTSWGEQKIAKNYQQLFNPGADWKEATFGTNAIGTALKTGNIVQIQHDEHFLISNRFMTGSAAPIFGIDRQMLGVIDISSDTYLPDSHTLGMVKIMSQAVENQIITSHFKNEYFLLRFNTSVENIDSQWSGLIVFDETGLIISANNRAELILGSNLKLVNITSLFNINVHQLINQPKDVQIPLLTSTQFRVHAIINKPVEPKAKVLDFRTLIKPDKTAAKVSKPNDLPLDKLNFGDPVVEKAVAQSKRIIDKSIPILIYGETGVGKEFFVKALHNSSQRAKQNMITVNCAAIPQELVESELFGYEKGAFTGSSQKGYIGLIRKADKGTLFLDEIGDMPMNVQARLLRVLQERKVNPLGSTESYPVDFKLISATNCNLKALVNAGKFRKDLYYRVSGLNIELPALRHRTDRKSLIYFLLNYYAENESHSQITERAMDSFCQHSWPGNIRQLVSVIQIAQAMSDNAVVDLEHLPEDFFADMNTKTNDSNIQLLNTHKDDKPTYFNSDVIAEDIVALYQSLNCNISKTAAELGISRNTVYKRLRECGYK
jgi:transcriptional regulator of acetoin/glycerol metabolism